MSQRPDDPMEGAVLPPELVEALVREAKPVPPAPAVADRLRNRVLATVRAKASEPPCHTARAEDGEWLTLTPLIDYRVLVDAPDARTVLYRFRPGGWVRAHSHHGDEESFVLEGSLLMGDVRIGKGDFHRAPAGSSHGEVFSDEGCVVLIRHGRAQPRVLRSAAGD